MGTKQKGSPGKKIEPPAHLASAEIAADQSAVKYFATRHVLAVYPLDSVEKLPEID
jgi:hypothetical protein